MQEGRMKGYYNPKVNVSSPVSSGPVFSTDQVKARSGAGLKLTDDGDLGMTVEDGGAVNYNGNVFKNDLHNLQDVVNLASVKGGVLRCIDKATGDTARTTTGWIEDEKYGWYMYRSASSASAEFDSVVKRTGRYTLKMSTVDATGRLLVICGFDGVNSTSLDPLRLSKYAIAVKPSTKYRYRVFVKTTNVAGVLSSVNIFDSTGSRTAVINSSTITGTNDWTLIELSFTTGISDKWLIIVLANNTAGNISDAWVDVNSITLEEITEDTLSAPIAQKQLTRISGVESFDNVDQEIGATSATTPYSLTNAVNEGATHLQTFTPTKKKQSKVGIRVLTKGTGDWFVLVHDSSNVLVAGCKVLNADLSDASTFIFYAPWFWTSGAYHIHIYSSDGTGTVDTGTDNDLENAKMTFYYAKFTENIEVRGNGVLQEFRGQMCPHQTFQDLGNGEGIVMLRSDYTDGSSLALINTCKNNAFDIAESNSTQADIVNYDLFNRIGVKRTNPALLYITNSSAKVYVVYKVSSPYPIKRVEFEQHGRHYAGSTTDREFQYSYDNKNWVTFGEFVTTGVDTTRTTKHDFECNKKSSVIYIRIIAKVLSNAIIHKYAQITCFVDLGSHKPITHYPTGVDLHFSQQLYSPLAYTRLYFRKNKRGMPSLELENTGSLVGAYILLPKNHQLETTPKVVLKSTTTGYQASGTGAAITGGYELDDGEYMTLSSALNEIQIDYYIPASCNTKNYIAVSSNGSSDSAVEDPAFEAKVGYSLNDQGVVETLGDLVRDVASCRDGLVKAGDAVLDVAVDNDEVTVEDSRVLSTSKIWLQFNEATLEADTIAKITNIADGSFKVTFFGAQSNNVNFSYFFI